MNRLILGCGYVGREVAKLWQQSSSQANDQLTVTTTTPEKVEQLSKISDRVEVVNGSDQAAIAKVIENQEVVLLSVGAKGRDTYRQSYLETANNLVAALQTNTSVKQLIYTGSYAVLGDRQGQWTDEATPTNPVTDGGKVLTETEAVLLSASTKNRQVCILRLAGIYGQGRELIKIFGRAAGTTRPGNGADYSNWIHLTDIVQAIEVAREQKLAGIYHVACDQCLTTGEFFQRLFKAHNLPGITWDKTKKSTRAYNTRLSNQKIKDAGLELTYPEIDFSLVVDP